MRWLVAALLVLTVGCATTGTGRPPETYRTVLVENRSMDTYRIRHRGFRVGTVAPDQTECVRVYGNTEDPIQLTLHPVGGEPFQTWRTLGPGMGWEVIISNISRAMGTEHIVPAPRCQGE